MKTKQRLLYSIQLYSRGYIVGVQNCSVLPKPYTPGSFQFWRGFGSFCGGLVHLGSHKIVTFKSEEHALSQNTEWCVWED